MLLCTKAFILINLEEGPFEFQFLHEVMPLLFIKKSAGLRADPVVGISSRCACLLSACTLRAWNPEN